MDIIAQSDVIYEFTHIEYSNIFAKYTAAERETLAREILFQPLHKMLQIQQDFLEYLLALKPLRIEDAAHFDFILEGGEGFDHDLFKDNEQQIKEYFKKIM